MDPQHPQIEFDDQSNNDRNNTTTTTASRQKAAPLKLTFASFAKLDATRGFSRSRSYDAEEDDYDIDIIFGPDEFEEIEREMNAKYQRCAADPKASGRRTRQGVGENHVDDDQDNHTHNRDDLDVKKERNFATFLDDSTNLWLKPATNRWDKSTPKLKTSSSLGAITPRTFKTPSRTKAMFDVESANHLLDQQYNRTVRLFIKKCALNWNFNLFKFHAMCLERSLTELLLHLFDYYDLYNIFKLDTVKVLKCFRLIECNYHATNPYHNSVHAADVTQAMHCFIQEKKIRPYMTDLEILCSILAAVCHDLDHPGVNQSFLIATNNPLARLYGNNSVLENHHWRFALSIFKESKLFEHFSSDLFDNMKEQLKHLILATDIARQRDYLKRFKDLTTSEGFSMENVEDRGFILQIALKCADLSNPCRPWRVSSVWSGLICDEFHEMGEMERLSGIPFTPICHRQVTSIASIQTEFFLFVALPLFQLWHEFLGSPLGELLMSEFNNNYKRWENNDRGQNLGKRRKSVASLLPDNVRVGTPVNEDNEPPLDGATCRARPEPDLETYYANHPIATIKRAVSDYIKCGDDWLESLRDITLDHTIEKSRTMMRSGRFGPKTKTNVGDKPHEPRQQPLEGHTSERQQQSSSTVAAGEGHQSVSPRKMPLPVEDGQLQDAEAHQQRQP